MLVVMHHSLYDISLLECGDFAQVRNNCFHVDNMKQLFQDIHIVVFCSVSEPVQLSE